MAAPRRISDGIYLEGATHHCGQPLVLRQESSIRGWDLVADLYSGEGERAELARIDATCPVAGDVLSMGDEAVVSWVTLPDCADHASADDLVLRASFVSPDGRARPPFRQIGDAGPTVTPVGDRFIFSGIFNTCTFMWMGDTGFLGGPVHGGNCEATRIEDGSWTLPSPHPAFVTEDSATFLVPWEHDLRLVEVTAGGVDMRTRAFREEAWVVEIRSAQIDDERLGLAWREYDPATGAYSMAFAVADRELSLLSDPVLMAGDEGRPASAAFCNERLAFAVALGATSSVVVTLDREGRLLQQIDIPESSRVNDFVCLDDAIVAVSTYAVDWLDCVH